MPAITTARPMSPPASPASAEASPLSAPAEARIRRSEPIPAQMANGEKMPKGSARRPSTSAWVAARSRVGAITCLPEGSLGEKHVEDRADAPEERDDDPQDLAQTAHVLATDDVDHAQDPDDGVKEDSQQNLS